jgi:FlaG/FlaF family flagellin (archaellin)
VVIPTYYYRTHFNLPATPEHVISLKLRTLVDDFDDFFLNGQEAHRSSGYQAGYTTPFFGYAGGTAVTTASVLGPFDVATSLLTAGTNTAAAIVNQVNGTSSDSTFAYELIAVIDQFTEPPRLSVSIDSASGLVTITWTDNSAILYAADDINVPPAGWAAVSAPNETSYSTSAGSAAGQKFFTLRKP